MLTISYRFLLFLNLVEFWKVQWINRKWCIMQNYVLIIFLWTFPHKLLYFVYKCQKPDNLAWHRCFFFNYWRNTRASAKTFTENLLWRNFALHFTSYLSIALFQNSAPFKNNKKCHETVSIWWKQLLPFI